MKKSYSAIILSLLLSACAGPHYAGIAIPAETQQLDIVVIKDDKTREGFFTTVTTWLSSHNYKYEVAADGSKHDLKKVTLEYIGYWKWDLALYLSTAKITAYNEGQRVGMVEYNAPNTLSSHKFGNGEERIGYMMDVLFNKKSDDEATALANQ